MKEKKNINMSVLCTILLIIIAGAVGYLYYRVFFQMPRDIVFCTASQETLSYQLFDNQFSHILTTITILIAMFGLAIPLATYFFQQRNFRDDKAEINRIKDKFDQDFNAFRDMKCEFPAMQKDFQRLKQAKDTIKKSINIMQAQNKKSKNLIIAMLPTSLNLYLESYKQKHNERKAYLFIIQIFIVLSELREEKEFNCILSLITTSSVALKSIQEEFFNSALQKIKDMKSFNSLIMSIKTLPDSKEKKEFMELYNILFDKQSKDSSEVGS